MMLRRIASWVWLLALLGTGVWAQSTNVPARNPWLADSIYPISHHDPAGTDVTAVAGPVRGRKLTPLDIRIAPAPWISQPTVKRIGNETVVIASGGHGVMKIRATGESFDVISNLLHPEVEVDDADALLKKMSDVVAAIDQARRDKNDEAVVQAGSRFATELLGLGVGGGAYNLIDRDGYHYAAYGTHILKSFDDNDVNAPMRRVKYADVVAQIPKTVAERVGRITGLSMTYDGHLAAAANGALFVLDRDLTVKDYVAFVGEDVRNGIALDERGIYVVTTASMRKIVWTGERLSTQAADGAWMSAYDVVTDAEASELGVPANGSGTTPTLLGFGDDEDKLVVIVDGNPNGPQLVAFWRDEIPADFTQKPDTRSRRIADQIRVRVSPVSTEVSPVVYGNGVALINTTYPRPAGRNPFVNGIAAGVTRPAPMGMQKFEWVPTENRFIEAWTFDDVDNSDWMVPAMSPKSGLLYAASKRNGIYEYIGVDWRTGELKARWEFPDDSVIWNAWGGVTCLLEDGDLLLGGLFGVTRVDVGHLR